LCAAPGGKSTKLLCQMKNTGVLVSNDVSFSRSQALLKNLELFGASNAIVTAETPERLSNVFPAYFDKILIDAPCSGEGMFRKDPNVIKSWVEHGNSFYVSLQRSILKAAVSMLRPGGTMVYSTCTFAKEEDEEAVLYAMEICPDLELIQPDLSVEGSAEGISEPYNAPELKKCLRLYPHRVRGEGHFAALLKKNGASVTSDPVKPVGKTSSGAVITGFSGLSDETRDFLRPIVKRFENGVFERCKERLNYLPDDFPDTPGLRLLRKGLFTGEEKKGRFEPSEALSMSLNKGEFPNELTLSADDPRVLKYLKGETIETAGEDLSDGYVLVTVCGHPLGFAKNKDGVLKNKYLPGWRYS
ncbi:MAG: RsmB/NOP family class I SAM-dependent RNA methyltransferase, partial [Lachnospiraceae bacterium]|nr:RsmB/NOP family class I SAM-dependent RNA methyltransferase [Lachnospiraceae bacterium]